MRSSEIREYFFKFHSNFYESHLFFAITPSNAATVACYLDFCSNFTNSNTMADKRLMQAGVVPPDTGNSNVPGGLLDSEKTPADAALNAATNVLNKALGKTSK